MTGSDSAQDLTATEQALFADEEIAAAAFSDNCFRCLYEGYSFCTDDGKTGTCQPAFCVKILDDNGKEVKGLPCTLRGNKC